MSERLTPEEIERLREADECWDLGTTGLRAVREMLRLHDLVERLRNLDYRDVTDEQQQRLWEDYPHLTKRQIARSVCVMLGGET